MSRPFVEYYSAISKCLKFFCKLTLDILLLSINDHLFITLQITVTEEVLLNSIVFSILLFRFAQSLAELYNSITITYFQFTSPLKRNNQNWQSNGGLTRVNSFIIGLSVGVSVFTIAKTTQSWQVTNVAQMAGLLERLLSGNGCLLE